MQIGFMPGRGTRGAIFIIRYMMKKSEVAGRNLYIAFVDLERTLDRVPRELIWLLLRRKEVLEREIEAIMEIHINIHTTVEVECTSLGPFDVKVEFYQEWILSKSCSVCIGDGCSD